MARDARPHRPLGARRPRRSPTASCSRRWPGSATGSCACRPSATAPGWRSREMVSSFAIHHGNEKTCTELLRIHPDERTSRAGLDPALRPGPGRHALARPRRSPSAAPTSSTSTWAARCPKVCKTGAGAALLDDPDTAVAVARAAREGSGLPVTVKLRSGQRPGETDGFELAHRLVDEAGVAAIGFHPRSRPGPPQGHARLRPRRAARRGARRAGDPHRRPARRASGPRAPSSGPAPPR